MVRARTALLAVALAALTACGGGEGDEASPAQLAPYLAPDGPLRAPVHARVREDGTPAEPTTAFAVTETEANAFVSLDTGVPAGSKLVIAWYRLRGDDREHLFSHEVEVRERGLARSQALAPSGLPSGLYETVATLGDRSTRTPWLVTEHGGATRSLSGARSAAAAASEIGPGVSSWDDDGWDSAPSAPPGPDDGACRTTTGVRAIVELTVHAGWNAACDRLTVAASVTGPPETLLTIVAAEQMNDVGILQHSTAVSTSMCGIPGGSDLPGTVVRAVVTDSGGATAAVEETLEDLGPALQAGLDPSPPSGSRVRVGDRIQLHALAMLMSPALGVKSLYVNANDELVDATGNLSGASEPRPCDPRRLLALLRTEYRVPDDPPPVIEICANAVGFDGTQASPDCASFVTRDVEVWEGTWDAGFHVIGTCTPAVWPQVGTLRATVAADGTLSGQGDLVNHTGVCGGSDVPQEVPVTPLFTGTRTDEEIRLQIQLPGLGSRTIPMPRRGDVAEGTLTVPLGGGSRWEIRARLECTTCG